MDAATLATQIKLLPRACVLHGIIGLRQKNKGALKGTTPFYLVKDNPTVDYRANGEISPFAAAAGIEVVIHELPNKLSVFAGARKVSNFGQVAFGSNGVPPQIEQYLVLREVGQILERITDRSPVFVVSVPIMAPGEYGTTLGVHSIAGIFNLDGSPIWIHPSALDTGLLDAPFPGAQVHRSLTSAGSTPAAANNPIAQLRDGLAAAGLAGAGLETALIAALTPTMGNQTAAAVKAFLIGPSAPQKANDTAPTANGLKTGVRDRLAAAAKAKGKGRG